MNSTVQFLEQQLRRVSCEEFVLDETFYAEVRNLLDMYKRCLTGGCHAAVALYCLQPGRIDWDFKTHDEALTAFGPGAAYEVWCCWHAIMKASAHAALTEPPTRGEQ